MVRTLRGPQGCPWDRAQTPASLAGHLVEESYEVLHSSREGDLAHLAEEVGDAAFLLAMVQLTVEERGGPAFDAILESTLSKLTRRHPHVFGHETVSSPAEAARLWETVKRRERTETGSDAPEAPDALGAAAPPEALPEPPPALPALLQAHRIQQKAAAVGFDWPDARAVVPKIEEELAELRAAIDAGSGHDAGTAAEAVAAAERGVRATGAVREEIGDLLFSVVNLARAMGLDAEEELRAATRKFRRRFNQMAVDAARRGESLTDLDLDEMEARWQAVKRAERGDSG